MPIDFLAQKKAAEQRVSDMLSGRSQGINDELAQTGAGIAQSRNQYLGNTLSGALGSVSRGFNVPQAQQADTSLIRRNLGSAMNVNLAQTRRNLNSQRISAIYNQAITMAQDAGYNRQAAEDFARQHMNQDIQQQNETWMGQFGRDQAVRRADIGESFANQGLALQNSYAPQMDYQSSLMRVLTGLPVQIGTSYLLNRGMKTPTATPSAMDSSSKIYGQGSPYDALA